VGGNGVSISFLAQLENLYGTALTPNSHTFKIFSMGPITRWHHEYAGQTMQHNAV
jgi:hypothetical protein